MIEQVHRTTETIQRATREWLEEVVIGMNLCPYANASLPGLRIVVSTAPTVDALMVEIEKESRHLVAQDPEEPATTLVVLPTYMHDISYDQFMEDLVTKAYTWDVTYGEVQIVPSLPEYPQTS
eukprot:gnl/TRDRNA2_/TRDRNA2_139226_c0_seq1.p1 gnl/TRDRNA2_/TRDRNA2_139226_c0~~gnl/TRDRNA2_/TRDRNA2_139226_c0_seq1.p1  ORF type:complete len:123 (+),score=14.95 gnl/TRDRNA2_/TRDRNA2_139226_c0_seq1:1-369(+)